MNEQWRVIEAYETIYEVSDCGRVRRLAFIHWWGNHMQHVPTHFIKGHLTRHGYWRVQLSRDKKQKLFLVHRLVAAAFLGPRPPAHEVHHRNGDKLYNHVTNLEYVTRSQNVQYDFDAGLRPSAAGSRNPRAKLTGSDVREIRRLSWEGMTGLALAKMFGVSSSTIYHVLKNRTWTFPNRN